MSTDLDTHEPPKRRRRAYGPLVTGSAAALLATSFMGGYGLIGAVFAVGSWWVYKFWPRPSPPLPPEAQAFIDRLDGVRPDEIDMIPGERIEDIRL